MWLEQAEAEGPAQELQALPTDKMVSVFMQCTKDSAPKCDR